MVSSWTNVGNDEIIQCMQKATGIDTSCLNLDDEEEKREKDCVSMRANELKE